MTAVDEVKNQSQKTMDGLGRLIKVLEANGSQQSPSMETDYSYDTLNDLLSVTQWGGANGIAGSRIRSFTYDSLSRLIQAFNPETGYVCYGTTAGSAPNGSNCTVTYDSNGNLLHKTDARGKTITYTYDGLNRLTGKQYSDSTPKVGFGYDGKDENGSTLSPPVSNAIGRLSHSSNEVNAAENFSYDVLGRLNWESYCTPQNCSYGNMASAAYDLAGDMTSLTYPDGRVVSQTFDAVARLSSVNFSSWNGTSVGTPYATINTYDAVGHPTSTTMGNGVSTAAGYNPRLELTSLKYSNSTSTLWNKNLTWTSNSNLQTAADQVAGVTRQFGYDTLNRVTSAQDIAGTPASSGQTTDGSDSSQSNILQNVVILGAPGMGGGAVTVVPNALAAPDGTMTASAATGNSGSTNSAIFFYVQDPALYAGGTATGWIWLRVPSGTLSTSLNIANVGDQGSLYNGTTNVTLTTTWQKVQVTTASPLENGLSQLYLLVAGGNTFSSGQVIDFWGAQLQYGSTAGSVTNYIPYSQQVGMVAWTPYCAAANASNITGNTSAVTAPDGTHTATAFVMPSSFSCGASGAWGAYGTLAGGLVTGQTYTESIWLKGAKGGENIILALNDCNVTYLTLTTAWERYVATYPTISSSIANCSSGSRGLEVLDDTDANATFYTWGAQLETAATAGQYVVTLDSPVTVSSDSTNILPSSEQVGGGGWTISNASLTSNTTVVAAPDGSSTADAITTTAAGGSLQDAAANPGLYDAATVTASVYLAVPSGTPSINIYLYSVGASNTQVKLPVSLNTSWQRFDVTGTVSNALTKLYLQVGDSSLASGQTIYVWGAQMVMGSSEGAPIQTTDTTTSDQNGSTVYLAANGLNESFTYDPFGNMLQAGNFNFQQAFTVANQLSGYTYDASGDVLSDGLGHIFTYDAEARISTVSGNTYVYDAGGDRVGKTGGTAVDTFYFGGRPLARLLGGQWTDLIYGATGLLAEVPGTQAGAPVYRMTDHLGTVVGTFSSAGVLLSSSDYAPFGELFTGGTPDPFIFTGKERDAESGLDYFGARYYGSSMGRFMSPDPLYLEMHRLVDPQQLNLYTYGRNNPLSITDPTGLDITCGGTRCADYLSALQQDIKGFKVDYDKNGKVETVGDVDKKGLSKSDKAFLGAIDDAKNHVTINAVGGAGDSSVFFGASHGSSHTINFDQAALLDGPNNAGGMTSAGLVGHETLEGYDEAKGYSMMDGHNWAASLGFPGFDTSKVTGALVQGGMVVGLNGTFHVQGTSINEQIQTRYATPIPQADFLKGKGLPAPTYPVSVEKQQ